MDEKTIEALASGEPDPHLPKSRINWALIPLGVIRECATHGCGNPAAYEFESGGVASTYCVRCTAGIERVLSVK